jgi:hypothetical protein
MKKEHIPASLRKEVIRRDNGRCRGCGLADTDNLAADHIVPEYLGGATTLENLQTLCHCCNSIKGTVIISLPIWQALGSDFQSLSEIADSRNNFRKKVANCRQGMLDSAAKSAREWMMAGVDVDTIKARLPALVGNSKVRKVIFQAFRHDIESLKKFS